MTELERVQAGMPLVYGGSKVARVPPEIAERFVRGDAIVVVPTSGEVLHIPAADRRVVDGAVTRACQAFARLHTVADADIDQFYDHFARNLESDTIWSRIVEVNRHDVEDATLRGRSTTRLAVSDRMRRDMIDGLRGWIGAPSRRGQVIEEIDHGDWRCELIGAALGVVGFVFEGRPNVLADATGVLRGGNAVVFRIGSDALRTAKVIMEQALEPALAAAGLPPGAVGFIDSAAHAAGWALFSDARLGLAVARGSGGAVATLGALAQQAGVPVSLHGRGGAWIVVSNKADAEVFGRAVLASLDRKVCNTLNTCCIARSRAQELVPVLLARLQDAGVRLGQSYKLHVVEGDEEAVPRKLFERTITVRRAEGNVHENQAESIAASELGREWEWEQTPEVTLALVNDWEHGVELFNRYSPQFIASLISSDPGEHERFYAQVNAPFVGDGHTRWVDGQKALNRPELGLSNWERGRLFGRGGVLSGDSVYTVRTRARSK